MTRSLWFRLAVRSTRNGQLLASWKRTTPRKKKLKISWQGNKIVWIVPKITGIEIRLNKQGSKNLRKTKKRHSSQERIITPPLCRYKKPCVSRWPHRVSHQPLVKYTQLASRSRKQAKLTIPGTHLQQYRECMIISNRRRSSRSC